MAGWYDGQRPITIAILAMGGEGGGVLADWIVSLGEANGYIAQSTSVAGVAQRTGTTVYYVELYPMDKHRSESGAEPVLSVFPAPGEVDIVIASELMEAGRAVQRGFCTPDRTVLITSTSRVYTMTEKMSPGDGRVDSALLLAAAQLGSKRFIGADFEELSRGTNSVISAALFGGLAGADALPFERVQFENAVRESSKGVEASLAAFALGFDAAKAPPQLPTVDKQAKQTRVDSVSVEIGPRPTKTRAEKASEAAEKERYALALSDPARLVGPSLGAQAERVASEFPAAARSMLLHGVERTAVYQDADYANRYLDRVARIAAVDPARSDGATLTIESARNVALWMCYQDTSHVALQKIRTKRIEGIREEAKAGPKQLIQVREFLHPQAEEICDSLPVGIGGRLAKSKSFERVVGRLTAKGIVLNTTSVVGYTLLWSMARLRPMRPRSLRWHREQGEIDSWLDLVIEAVDNGNPALAVEIIECQRVRKGYGETYARGRKNFDLLIDIAREIQGRDDAKATLSRLISAALADEDGTALQAATATVYAQG